MVVVVSWCKTYTQTIPFTNGANPMVHSAYHLYSTRFDDGTIDLAVRGKRKVHIVVHIVMPVKICELREGV